MKFSPDRSLMDIISSSKIEANNELSSPQESQINSPSAIADHKEKKIFLAKDKISFSSFSMVCHEFGHLADAHLDNLESILPDFNQIKQMTIDFSTDEVQAFADFFNKGVPFPLSIIDSVSRKIIGKLIDGHNLDFQLIEASAQDIFEAAKRNSPFLEKGSKIGDEKTETGAKFNVYDKKLKRVEVVSTYFEFAATQIVENTFKKLRWTDGEIFLQDYLNVNPAYARIRKLAMGLLEKNYVPKNSGILKREG